MAAVIRATHPVETPAAAAAATLGEQPRETVPGRVGETFDPLTLRTAARAGPLVARTIAILAGRVRSAG